MNVPFTSTGKRDKIAAMSFKWFRTILRKSTTAAQLALRFLVAWVHQRGGLSFLNKAQTEAYLQPFQLFVSPEQHVLLPEVPNAGNAITPVFSAAQAITEPVFVWQYQPGGKKTFQKPYGGIVTGQRLLCTDSTTSDYYRNTFHRRKRETSQTNTLIAPWSHYLDGFIWGGYYDFVMLVAGKLCRMKEALPESVFSEAVVAYPLFGTEYEKEYLALLGIAPERVVDSRTTNVVFDTCILGNIGHWFYPNVADILALRNHILAQTAPLQRSQNRIYVSRSNRRRVQNEAELIRLLAKYDFQIIEDKPRSVAEQIAMYRHASFIIGPHGASFTNILWCEPDTFLFELFSASYKPDFFRYMAQVLGLRYAAYHYGAPPVQNWATGLTDDLFVSIPDLERCLDRLLLNTSL